MNPIYFSQLKKNRILDSSNFWNRLVISEMKFMVQVNFHWFKCDFVTRECNRVAHVIAASGYECEQGFEQIMSSLPAHINVIVADDSSVHE